MEKLERLCFSGNVKWLSHCEKVWQSLKTSNRIAPWPGNSTPGCVTKRTESRYSNKCLYMIAHSSTTYNRQKVETAQIMHQWMTNQLGLSVRGNILSHKAVRSDTCRSAGLQDTGQAKQAEHKNTNTVWFYLYLGPGIVQLRETGNGMVVARVWGQRGMGSCLMGSVSHLQDEEFWKSDAKCECT